MVAAALVIIGGYHLFAKYQPVGPRPVGDGPEPRGRRPAGRSVAGARIVAFALAGVISGLAGIAIAPVTFANPTLGINYALKGFVAMAIGGFGSTDRAALLGGALLGVTELMVTTYGNDEYQIYASLGLLLLVLWLRPRGLIGAKPSGPCDVPAHHSQGPRDRASR